MHVCYFHLLQRTIGSQASWKKKKKKLSKVDLRQNNQNLVYQVQNIDFSSLLPNFPLIYLLNALNKTGVERSQGFVAQGLPVEVSSGLLVSEPCCADGIRVDVTPGNPSMQKSGREG